MDRFRRSGCRRIRERGRSTIALERPRTGRSINDVVELAQRQAARAADLVAHPHETQLASAARLYFDSMTDTGSIFWTLAGPAGIHVSNRPFNNSDSFDIGNPVLSLPAGAYTITIDASGDVTGSYTFRLMDLTSATPFTPATPVSGALTPATETDLYRFDVVAGQQYYFDVTTSASNASWRLIDPFSNVVFFSGFGSDVDTITLSRAGTYTLMIEGRFNAGSGTASYAFDVKPVSVPVTVPVAIGDVINGTIAVSGEQDQFSFVLPVATAPMRHALVEVVRRHNLPQQVTSFVGRDRESVTIKALLANNRLVTVVGAGGAPAQVDRPGLHRGLREGPACPGHGAVERASVRGRARS